MLVDRKVVEERITQSARQISSEKRSSKKNDICVKLEDEYNIPFTITSDILSLRMDFSQASDFIVFAVLKELVSMAEIKKYYSSVEIKNYEKARYEREELKGYIKFDVIPVGTNDNQWIGSTTFKYLMMLRDAHLINYNENTQRTLTRIIKNNKEEYIISLNQKAVDQIKESMKNGQYISDTITINIPEDAGADFVYKDGQLIIKDATHLDLIDGYHRYIAFCRNYDLDQTFDYPIEIRITNFSEDKAKQFIFQQDQKTQMKKADSNTFNAINPGNQVIERLNTNSLFNLTGEIQRNGGMISYGMMSAVINGIYFQSKNTSKKEIIEVSKVICDKLNYFTEECTNYLEKTWSDKEVIVILSRLHQGHKPSEIAKEINDKKFSRIVTDVMVKGEFKYKKFLKITGGE